MCVCVCEGEFFFFLIWWWGKNGSCQRVARATGKTPSSFPSFPGRRAAAPMISGGDCGRKKALTQRNATLRRREHPTVTQHFFFFFFSFTAYWIVLEAGRSSGGGGQTSKIIPRRVFFFFFFFAVRSLSFVTACLLAPRWSRRSPGLSLSSHLWLKVISGSQCVKGLDVPVRVSLCQVEANLISAACAL